MSVARWWSRTLGRLRHRSLLEAAMASAALISTSDHEVRLAEQLALDRVLERFEVFQVFDPHVAVDRHRRFAERILADRARGRREALRILTGFRGGEAQRRLLLRVGEAIAAADSVVSASEREALTEIADALGMPADAISLPDAMAGSN